MAAQYQLVMHSGPTPGKVFPLSGDIIIIGREAENGIVINDAEISRKHTQLVFQGGKYIVTDLGSTNGTFVNGQRLTGQHVLIPGETVSLGEQINLLFEISEPADPNATIIQGAHAAPAPRTVAQQHYAPKPQYQPQPSYQPMPQPMYAGQVPAGPPPMQMAPAPAKANNSRLIIILVGVLALLMICGCIGLLWYIDATNNWCTFMPFLFPAGTCG